MADETTPMRGGKDEKDPLTGAANKMREDFAKELASEVTKQMKVVSTAADVYRAEKTKLRQIVGDARKKRDDFDATMKDMTHDV